MITEEKHSSPTCKTCGFYENNCPFIRGKFVPYPSRVCKDYTDSTIEPADRAFHRLECKHNGYGICILQSGYRGKNCHITVACNGKCRRMKIWDTKHGYKGVEFKILEEL